MKGLTTICRQTLRAGSTKLHWWACLPLAAATLGGCRRGASPEGPALRAFVAEGGASLSVVNAIDCPDGLARCREGNVEVSGLATIRQPCAGPPSRCGCPWERIATCDRGCVADGVELVMERPYAPRQLCATEARRDGVTWLTSPSRQTLAPPRCDEGELYRCSAGQLISCAAHAVVGFCEHGCVAEQSAISDDDAVSREAAFAILCSR
jgi:hypothetical protein